MKKVNVLVVALALFVASAFGQETNIQSDVKEDISLMAQKGLESLEWSLLLEAEGFYSKVGDEQASDLVLATVEFKLEVAVTDWLKGNVGLLWEEDSRENDNIDEGFITLGASESIPYYFVAGRFWQPVGNFESAFISDPLTLELMEMNQTAGMVGCANPWVDVNAGAFKGDTKKGVAPGEGGDSTISDFFVSAALTPVEQIKFGAYWLSDLMETYNYGYIGDEIAQVDGYEKVGGAGAYLNLYLGRFTFNAEFASALNEYITAEGNYRPAAYNIEGSYEVLSMVTVGLKYESSDDLYAGYDRSLLEFGDKYPGMAYGAVVSYEFHENAAVGVEYLRLDELGDDKKGDLFTVQLAFEV